jgi:hypothetical protein
MCDSEKEGSNVIPGSSSSDSVDLVSSSESGIKRRDNSADNEKGQSEEVPDVPTKRPRGPFDCLDWDDSDEEEFVPFTQSYSEESRFPPRAPSPVAVFAKKSSAKGKGLAKKKGPQSLVKTSGRKASAKKSSGARNAKKKSGEFFCRILGCGFFGFTFHFYFCVIVILLLYILKVVLRFFRFE